MLLPKKKNYTPLRGAYSQKNSIGVGGFRQIWEGGYFGNRPLLWYLTYYSYLLKSGQFSQIIATQQLPYFLWICFKNGRGTIFDKKCIIVKLLSLYRMHFICFIVFPNATQNRIIFCDRMITNHAVLLQKRSSSFLSIFLINLINQESSGGPTLILSMSPLDLSTTRSTFRERL